MKEQRHPVITHKLLNKAMTDLTTVFVQRERLELRALDTELCHFNASFPSAKRYKRALT